jgi:hypothetical protein
MIIKEFNQFITKSDIIKYLEENFSEEWFNLQLSERCYDYLDEDDTEEYDGIMRKRIRIYVWVELSNMTY